MSLFKWTITAFRGYTAEDRLPSEPPMNNSFGISFHRFLITAILGITLFCLLTGCGRDEPPPAPAEETQAQVDPVKNLLDVVQQQQIVPAKPAKLTSLTGDLAFPPVTLGDDQTQAVALKNEGEAPLTIKGVRIAGDETIFRLSGTCEAGTILDASSPVCRVDITFAPSEARVYETNLVITTDTGSEALFVKITGQGENAFEPAPIAEIPAPQPTGPTPLQLQAMQLQALRKQGQLGINPVPRNQFRNQWIMSDADHTEIGYSKTQTSYPVDRSRIITADRYIPAVLENTINSQIAKGRIVAIVENHVYSGEGRNVLIPAGSRVIGEYKSLGKAGDSRLEVQWNRIIRPDGVGIDVRAPGADPMGRAGLIGDVDNKLFERFGMPLLISAIGVVSNYAFSPATVTSTAISGGVGGLLGTGGTQTTETTTRENLALRQFSSDAVNNTQQFLQQNVNTTPIITVPAGTRFLITPTRDIEFKSPQLLTAAGPAGDLVSQAQGLIKALQRGDVGAGSEKLVEILGKVAQQGAAGGAFDGSGGTPNSPFGLDNFSSNQLGQAPNSFGPPTGAPNPVVPPIQR
ncbi:MAG: hypothetical protein LW855_00700 [Alphaproteobacteria bacterium]|nr:hypothetical protein [Alphaproteobacteria bacterium]